MSWWKRLFGSTWPQDLPGGQGGELEDAGYAEQLEQLDGMRKPAIRLSGVAESRFSQIGGLPLVATGFEWPHWKGAPLSFLCQIDLSEVPVEFAASPLPSEGLLYFFYDPEQSTWGFDPSDRGSFRVLYMQASPAECTRATAPSSLDDEFIFEPIPWRLSSVLTWPDLQDDCVNIDQWTDEQGDAYVERCSAVFEDGPEHHLLGHPAPIQDNDMDWQSQLVSNGLNCGSPQGYSSNRARELTPGRVDWMLLLQLDTDDDAGMMWGDCGRLYFWIRRQDLLKRRFDDCWMILQCC